MKEPNVANNTPSLETLIEATRKHVLAHPQTDAEKDEHAISWVLGNLNASTNHQTTREQVERVYYQERLKQARERIRTLEAALDQLRLNASQLSDFLYGAVRECSADMIRVIDAARKGATEAALASETGEQVKSGV